MMIQVMACPTTFVAASQATPPMSRLLRASGLTCVVTASDDSVTAIDGCAISAESGKPCDGARRRRGGRRLI